MKVKPIVTKVHNAHITDKYGITISDKFTVVYESGVIRTFKCRNKLSRTAFEFLATHTSTADSITDKYGKTYTSITWR